MTTSPTITYTLEEFLIRFDQKIDRQFAELKQEVAGLKTELKQEIKELTDSLKTLLQKTAEGLNGHERRRFMAQTLDELGPGERTGLESGSNPQRETRIRQWHRLC